MMRDAGGRAGAIDSSLLAEVERAIPGDSRLALCIQCGTCGGSCPSATDMDHTPRALFALVRAGMRDMVLDSNTPWMCVSCYTCAVRCPQQVHIPDVMYGLRSIQAREGRGPNRAAPDFSRTFVRGIHRFGRSYEIGLVAIHYLRHFPLRMVGFAPTGLGMLARGRMGLVPHRIHDVRALRAILARAEAIEASEARP
jgi:heterodisulfide reductase subunit C2